jgi:hypothetical protein
MVRCGVVSHPREWVGYHELMGRRRRYRLLDLDRLCWRLGTEEIEEVRQNLEVVSSILISATQLPKEVEKDIAFLERSDGAEWQKPDEVVSALGLKQTETVVDLGAGSGYFSFRFTKSVPKGKVVARAFGELSDGIQ